MGLARPPLNRCLPLPMMEPHMSHSPSPRALRRARRPLRRAAAASLVACALAMAASVSPLPAGANGSSNRPAAHAAPAAPQAGAAPSTRPVAPPLSVGLDKVSVSSPSFDAAKQRADDLTNQVHDATARHVNAIAALIPLRAREAELTGQIADATSRARLATTRISVLKSALQDVAVMNYINGQDTSGSGLGLDLDVQGRTERGKQNLLASIVNSNKLERLRLTQAALDKARTQIAIATAVRDGVRQLITDNEHARDQAALDEVRFGADLLAATQDVYDASRLAMVDGVDFPLVVLDAYVKAADLMAVTNPSCGIQWWALAGIGRTESNHGTEGGAAVNVDGSLTKPILGIALDGTNSTAVVAGPTGFDRAQGPMQFISSTWARWQHDGNGDGKMDIQNFYDAAAGAAAYLCASGEMRDDPGLERGYFSYNQSLPYVAIVLQRAHGYQQALTVPGRP